MKKFSGADMQISRVGVEEPPPDPFFLFVFNEEEKVLAHVSS